MVTGLPTDRPAAPVRAAISAAAEVAGKHIPDGVVVPQHEREIILMQREIDSNAELVGAYAADADRLSAAKGSGSLSTPAATRLAKLEKALGAARATDAKLLAKAKTQVAALGGATPPCAGVAFVTFNDANDAVRLLQQGSVALPALGTKPFNVERPPEPSDVLWENLGCTDGAVRQLRGTIYMTLLSLGGAFLIGASAFLQPKAAQHSDADSPLKQLAVVAIGRRPCRLQPPRPLPGCNPCASQAATRPCRATAPRTPCPCPCPCRPRPCCSAADPSPHHAPLSTQHSPFTLTPIRHGRATHRLPCGLHLGAHHGGRLHAAHHGHLQGGLSGAQACRLPDPRHALDHRFLRR